MGDFKYFSLELPLIPLDTDYVLIWVYPGDSALPQSPAQYVRPGWEDDMDSSLAQGSELTLSADHEKLSRSGLSTAVLADTLHTALTGSAVAIAHLSSQEDASIFVRFQRSARDELSDLSRISLKAPSGALVPVLSVVRQVPGDASAPIMHDDREAMAVVAGEVSGRAVVYVVKDLILGLFGYSLPGGHGVLESWNLYGFTFRDTVTNDTYRLEWGGEFEMTLDNFRDLGLAMIVSYFLIYLILVAQFRSFRSPGLIMTTIILGFAGVLPGFALLDLLAGTYFSATSMIGVIALGGIVVGNAILLLDFIEQLRERGQTTKHAIVEACQTRLRPIMLTSITAILGSVVIVADPVWSGLAWAIIFGLSLSTVLTLVIFPVLYFRFGAADKDPAILPA
jgi:multidrug efflux pump subunit AcrB